MRNVLCLCVYVYFSTLTHACARTLRRLEFNSIKLFECRANESFEFCQLYTDYMLLECVLLQLSNYEFIHFFIFFFYVKYIKALKSYKNLRFLVSRIIICYIKLLDVSMRKMSEYCSFKGKK